MGEPISFVYGNCVFADGLDDCWAAFALASSSYAWLSEGAKRARFLALLGALEAVEADVQILRVCRRWAVEQYGRELREESVPEVSDPRMRSRERYIDEHVRRLGDVGASQPECVPAREPARSRARRGLSTSRALPEQNPREWLRAAADGRCRMREQADAERRRSSSGRVHAPIKRTHGSPISCRVRPARGVRAAVARAQGVLPGARASRRSTVCTSRARSCSSETARRCWRPLEGDVMRWADGYVEHRGRALRIESELGTSWQAQLVLGALPERVQFPGRAGGADVRARREPAVRRRPVAERALPAQRAGAADRAPANPGRRSDPARGVGRRAGRLRSRVRAHAARHGICSPTCRPRASLRCCARRSRSRSAAREPSRSSSERVEMCRRAYGEVRLHRPLGRAAAAVPAAPAGAAHHASRATTTR